MASSNLEELDSTYLLELARLLHRVLGESQSEVIDGVIPSNAKNPPASQEFMASLRTTNKSNENCAICLGPFGKTQLVKELPKCNHYFHADCILPWLGRTNTCPMCRHEYPTDDMEYEEKRRLKEKEHEREELLNDLHNSMFS